MYDQESITEPLSLSLRYLTWALWSAKIWSLAAVWMPSVTDYVTVLEAALTFQQPWARCLFFWAQMYFLVIFPPWFLMLSLNSEACWVGLTLWFNPHDSFWDIWIWPWFPLEGSGTESDDPSGGHSSCVVLEVWGLGGWRRYRGTSGKWEGNVKILATWEGTIRISEREQRLLGEMFKKHTWLTSQCV